MYLEWNIDIQEYIYNYFSIYLCCYSVSVIQNHSDWFCELNQYIQNIWMIHYWIIHHYSLWQLLMNCHNLLPLVKNLYVFFLLLWIQKNIYIFKKLLVAKPVNFPLTFIAWTKKYNESKWEPKLFSFFR